MPEVYYKIIDTVSITAGILMSCLESLINILSFDIYKLTFIAALAFLPFLIASLLLSAYISDRSI